MQKILIATGNQGKYKEMMEVLGELPIEFVTLKDLGMENDAEEDGETYADNSWKKAEHFYKKTGITVISEDSGLEVSALKNELGVKTRRWGAGENASDEEWIDFFLKRMKSEEDRTAKFCCVTTFYDGEDKEQFFGESHGELAKKPLCEIPKGIPVSALFIPQGKTTAFAAMSNDEKNAISHRGQAIHALKKFLEGKFL